MVVMTPAERMRDSLKRLTRFHYILGGMLAVLSLLALYALVVDRWLSGRDAGEPGGFPLAGVLAAVLGLIVATLLIRAGRCIARRRRHGFARGVALLECLLVPPGTLLGIATLAVLGTREVKELFREGQVQPSPNHDEWRTRQ